MKCPRPTDDSPSYSEYATLRAQSYIPFNFDMRESQMMAIWERCFGKPQPEPLQRLQRQKRTIEQRGCFSDQELDEKYYELGVIERRIKEVEYSRSRQHIQNTSASVNRARRKKEK